MSDNNGTNTRTPSILILAALGTTLSAGNVSLENTIEALPESATVINTEGISDLFFGIAENTGASFDLNELKDENVAISFVQNLINNSCDLDSKFVELVDENFWDLL